MTKEELMTILRYAEDNNVSQQTACVNLGYKRFTNISRFKKIYGLNERGTNTNYTGLKKRKYNVDDDFFETPNELNCYYAGFIAADGCLSLRDKGEISIEISKRDVSILENFKKDAKLEAPIFERTEKGKFQMVSLRFTSYKMRTDLERNFNITPQKSLTLTPPNLTNDILCQAFICGYIDGDGTICFYQRKNGFNNINLSILGTENMCEWIKSIFSSLTNNKGSIKPKIHTKIFRLVFTTKSAREIIKKLFVLDVPKLQRKWNESVYHHCFIYKQQHNHIFRKINVFDLNGNLIKKCNSLIEAKEITNVSKSKMRMLAKENTNKRQSNGFMFSYNDTMDKFEPPKTIKQSGRWRKERRKLISEGKIKAEDFPWEFNNITP